MPTQVKKQLSPIIAGTNLHHLQIKSSAKNLRMKRISIAIVIMAALMAVAVSCRKGGEGREVAPREAEEGAKADTIILKSEVVARSVPFLVLEMDPQKGHVALADSVVPDIGDSTIVLCVEAAFTGELLEHFVSTNVAGDYAVDGRLRKGYRCKANTGFLATEDGRPFIAPSESLNAWLDKKHTGDWCMFQQVLLVRNGKDVYAGKPIRRTSRNIYRAACIMRDRSFAVIQSLRKLPLGDFVSSLIALDVCDALYLDMGPGWNYGWYRQTVEDAPTKFFLYRTPFQTNWLLVKARS